MTGLAIQSAHDLKRMERKWKRLQRLQHMATSVERIAEKTSPCADIHSQPQQQQQQQQQHYLHKEATAATPMTTTPKTTRPSMFVGSRIPMPTAACTNTTTNAVPKVRNSMDLRPPQRPSRLVAPESNNNHKHHARKHKQLNNKSSKNRASVGDETAKHGDAAIFWNKLKRSQEELSNHKETQTALLSRMQARTRKGSRNALAARWVSGRDATTPLKKKVTYLHEDEVMTLGTATTCSSNSSTSSNCSSSSNTSDNCSTHSGRSGHSNGVDSGVSTLGSNPAATSSETASTTDTAPSTPEPTTVEPAQVDSAAAVDPIESFSNAVAEVVAEITAEAETTTTTTTTTTTSDPEPEPAAADPTSTLEDAEKQAKMAAAASDFALLKIKRILEEQKRRSKVQRMRIEEIKRANAAVDRIRHHGCDEPSLPSIVECWHEDDDSDDEVEETLSITTSASSDYFSSGRSLRCDSSDSNNLNHPDDLSLWGSNEVKDVDVDDFGSKSKKNHQHRFALLSKKRLGGDSTTANGSDISSQYSGSDDEDDDATVPVSTPDSSEAQLSYLKSRYENLRDEKETARNEMLNLLVEKQEELHFLRKRLCRLETNHRTAKGVQKGATLLLFLLPVLLATLVSSVVVQSQGGSAWDAMFGANNQHQQHSADASSTSRRHHHQKGNVWNGVCSPAQPGTVVTPESGVLQAPWWAPESLKQPAYHLMGCHNTGSPRLQMQVHENGMTEISSVFQNDVVVTKRGDKVYVGQDTLQIVDRHMGQHVELDAPWAGWN